MRIAWLPLMLVSILAFPSSCLAAATRISIGGVKVAEGDAGITKAILSVHRTGANDRVSRVRYATAAGTAAASRDFQAAAGKLRFGPGNKKRRIAISVRGDSIEEPDETIFVRLSQPRGARLGQRRARLTVVDDDTTPRGPQAQGTSGGQPAGAAPQPQPSPPSPQSPQPPQPPQPNQPQGGVVRFATLGNAGKGNVGQGEVAAAIEDKCATDGCDYVLGLGNNIFDDGVDSATDVQFQTKFEAPYEDLDLPFWMLLGSHDYGGEGIGNEFDKGQYQVEYSANSTKWKMPAAHYRRSDQHVEFFTLDTNLQRYGQDAAQESDVAAWLASSTAEWKIALGSHSYRSNGPHGNAGSYDGQPTIPVLNGAGVKEFMDDRVCGKADVYFSAGDQSLQWLEDSCAGTELVVSGAGATTTTLPGSNPTRFQSATLGFVYVVIEDDVLTAEVIDTAGTTLFSRTLTH